MQKAPPAFSEKTLHLFMNEQVLDSGLCRNDEMNGLGVLGIEIID